MKIDILTDMADTIFDKLISGEWKCWKVWEDEKFMAWLTPYANTPGVTVVVPKKNPGDYIFTIDNNLYHEFLDATKEVARLLEKAFDTSRVAMVIEGTGVAHVHAKLYPLHGKLADETGVWSDHTEFHPEYIGYITTAEGPKMSDEQLDKIQKKILTAKQLVKRQSRGGGTRTHGLTVPNRAL